MTYTVGQRVRLVRGVRAITPKDIQWYKRFLTPGFKFSKGDTGTVIDIDKIGVHVSFDFDISAWVASDEIEPIGDGKS